MLTEKINAIFPLYHSIFFQPFPIFSPNVHITTAENGTIDRWCSSYKLTSPTNGGLVPTILISPPDVKIETTFFQRKFFITTPCNHPQKQHKKRTSDLSEVPILRCFLKILPLSAPLPASYQIPPDCTLNGIYPSNDTSFLYPIRTFSISFAALAHC